jgi:transposase
MPKKDHVTQLSEIDRLELQDLVRKGSHKARVIRRAQILLWSDTGKTDGEIASLLNIRPLTVAQTRQKWVEDHSLEDKPRPGGKSKLDAKQEAFLVALACSDAPDGYESWTMQLLADKLVELKVIDAPISDETVRLRLKKSGQTLAQKAVVYPDSQR